MAIDENAALSKKSVVKLMCIIDQMLKGKQIINEIVILFKSLLRHNWQQINIINI